MLIPIKVSEDDYMKVTTYQCLETGRLSTREEIKNVCNNSEEVQHMREKDLAEKIQND